MVTAKPIIKQVDHIIIRVDDSSSDQLFALFSDTFQLPVAWPLASYTSFVSGGISRLWTHASSNTAASTRGGTIVFDHVYHDGMILLCEYNKELHDVEQARAADHATLDSRQGGPLGLEAIQEIIVGVTDLAAVEPLWQILLAPTAPSSPGFWQIGKGPAIRLIRHARNGPQALVWKVASLEQAKQFLSEKGLLGTVLEQQITIAPSKVQGLDIRLVEGAK